MIISSYCSEPQTKHPLQHQADSCMLSTPILVKRRERTFTPITAKDDECKPYSADKMHFSRHVSNFPHSSSSICKQTAPIKIPPGIAQMGMIVKMSDLQRLCPFLIEYSTKKKGLIFKLIHWYFKKKLTHYHFSDMFWYPTSVASYSGVKVVKLFISWCTTYFQSGTGLIYEQAVQVFHYKATLLQ